MKWNATSLSSWVSVAVVTFVSWGIVVAPTAAETTYTSTHVRIETPKKTIYNDWVYVPSDGCTVLDTSGEAHQITGDTALCALHLASTLGDFTYELVNSSFGLYLQTVGEVEANSDEFWLYYVNNAAAMVGLADYDLKENDDLLFTFGQYPSTPLRLKLKDKQKTTKRNIVATVKYYDEFGSGTYIPVAGAVVHFGKQEVVTDNKGKATFVFTEPGEYRVYAESAGYTRTPSTTVRIFPRHSEHLALSADLRSEFVDRGWNYVLSELNGDGLGSAGLNEWAVMAMTARGIRDERFVEWVSAYNPKMSEGASTTDIARHILAIRAIGSDPHNFNGVNFVERLKNTMKQDQFGNPAYVNDDIFAVLALNASGETVDSQTLRKAVAHSMTAQNTDGGFSFAVDATVSDVDTTAVWIQSISNLKNYPELGADVLKARKKALRYLRHQQNPDGGWGYADESASNSASTAWAMQAFLSAVQKPQLIRTNHRSGFDFLMSRQGSDGQVQYDAEGNTSNEILNTIYAIMPLSLRSLPI